MTERARLLWAIIESVSPIFRPLNWMLVLGEGSIYPTPSSELPPHLRRFAKCIRKDRQRSMRERSKALKRMGVRRKRLTV